MKNFLTICCRELAHHFFSPLAYLTITVFMGVTGLVFWGAVRQTLGEPISPQLLLFHPSPLWLMIIAVSVAITMRLIAEEKHTGTIEVLLTSPIDEAAIVLGKFAGAFCFFLAIVAPTALFLVVLRSFSVGLNSPDLGKIAGGYFCLMLVGSFYISVGLLASALTRRQVMAAVLSFSAIIVLFFAGYFHHLFDEGPIRSILLYISIREHVSDFSMGIIDSRPVVFYLSSTALMLFVATRAVEARRWKQ